MEPCARRVWVEERNAIFRRGLVSCVVDGGFELAGESAALVPEPSLARVGVFLFELDALDAALRLARPPTTRLVGIASSPSDEALRAAFEGGLSGVVMRGDLTPGALTASLDAVVAGAGALPVSLLPRLLDGLARDAGARDLAGRELDVLRLLAAGGDTRGIALELSYSERTVKNIVHDLLTKLNCRTRAHAVAVASRDGLV
jgi:DNA-binding NarL/FixJ family response regulator